MERCKKCIMPASAKGIRIGGDGLCQLCREHREFVPRGADALAREVEPFRRQKNDFNCIVPVSGGRDSSYALYYAVKALGLRPIAVHNDNDFETPVATRNLETITRSLGVPLIRVRSKNQLGKKIVADKFMMNSPFGASLVAEQTCEACQFGFESASYSTARKNGIGIILWADSHDESTAPYHRLVRHSTPSIMQRLISTDPIHVFAYKYHFYQLKKEYGPCSREGLKELHLFDYIRWDQKVIVDTIQTELGWSVPQDSPTTWRVDCSLVPIVNFLTEKAYGVSKIELGFANMVRASKMDREDALRKVELIKNNINVSLIRKSLRDIGICTTAIDRVLN